jgi:hypothetical protein
MCTLVRALLGVARRRAIQHDRRDCDRREQADASCNE